MSCSQARTWPASSQSPQRIGQLRVTCSRYCAGPQLCSQSLNPHTTECSPTLTRDNEESSYVYAVQGYLAGPESSTSEPSLYSNDRSTAEFFVPFLESLNIAASFVISIRASYDARDDRTKSKSFKPSILQSPEITLEPNLGPFSGGNHRGPYMSYTYLRFIQIGRNHQRP